MATPYDDTFKIFISENAQDFLSWLMKGAVLKEKLLTEFEGRDLHADALLQAVFPDSGEELLVQIECQSEKDPSMPERLLEYNLRARREHKQDVYSCVIYLRDDGEVQQSPLKWTMRGEQEILQFHYLVIELAKMAPDEFRQSGLPGIQPFMILTKGGATREVADEIFTSLKEAGKEDSLPAAFTLASLAFGKDNTGDQEWLRGRFRMHNVLRETPIYQEMTKEAREEGLQQGLQQGLHQGLQQGLQQGLRDALLDVVLDRFPKLIRVARKQIAVIEEPAVLRHLIVKISSAQTAEEAKQYLLEADEDEDED